MPEVSVKYSFDREHDIFWAYSKGDKAVSRELAADIWVEFDENNSVVGIEIHDASKVLGKYWDDPEGAAMRALELARRLASLGH